MPRKSAEPDEERLRKILSSLTEEQEERLFKILDKVAEEIKHPPEYYAEMTRFDRAEPDARFALPAHPTVHQQLEYYSRYSDTRNEPLYLRLWHSAQILISDWECADLPDYRIDLDKITSPQATTAIMWAGNTVLYHMNALESLPKV